MSKRQRSSSKSKSRIRKSGSRVAKSTHKKSVDDFFKAADLEMINNTFGNHRR
jgi:hypothetical protein